jgi:hypothetical protein
MKNKNKYFKVLTIFLLSFMALVGAICLVIVAERDDRIQTGTHPNSHARNTLIGIWSKEGDYLIKHDKFARSLSQLNIQNRTDSHTIEYISDESNAKIAVYRAIPDRFNWLMFDLSTYTITIVRSSNSQARPQFSICSNGGDKNNIPRVQVSSLISSDYSRFRCSKGSYKIINP